VLVDADHALRKVLKECFEGRRLEDSLQEEAPERSGAYVHIPSGASETPVFEVAEKKGFGFLSHPRPRPDTGKPLCKHLPASRTTEPPWTHPEEDRLSVNPGVQFRPPPGSTAVNAMAQGMAVRAAGLLLRPTGINVDVVFVHLEAVNDPLLKTEEGGDRLLHRRSEPPWDVVWLLIPWLSGRLFPASPHF